MHISFLTSEYPHLKTRSGGGIGTSVKSLANEISKKVEFVTVFVISSNEDMVFYDQKVRIVCIKAKSYRIGGWFLHRKYIEKKLNSYIKEYSIDIIEIPDWTGISAFMKLKCPVVIKIHGSDTYFCHLEKRKLKWKNYWFESLALRNADAIIGVSNFALETTLKLFKLNKQIPKIVIYNGIDIDDFMPFEYVNEPIILYFGTLIRKKGCLEIPIIFNEVQKKVPNSKLIIVGADSPDILTGNASTWEMMKLLFLKSSYENTEYMGKLSYDKIKYQIDKASVCIFPSFAETFGLVIVEAMAMEKVVVCANTPWVKEIIDNGVNGLYSDINDIKDYADNICRGFDKEFKKMIGKNARKKVVEQFNLFDIADKHIGFYKRISQK